MTKLLNRVNKFIDKIQLNPPLFLILSFAIIILLGSFLLNTGLVTQSGESIGFINALFTAGSATCVTGLIVVNTASTFNFLGKLFILILIQIGGLGIMSLATLFPLVMGKKIGLTSRQIIKEQLNINSLSGIISLLKYVLYFTLTMEAAGAILLASRFVPQYGWLQGVWYSIFHSVSAFCNAGFDILGDSFYPLREDYLINITLMILVIIGGLGFFVTQELMQHRKHRMISTHSKIVLTASGILIFTGAILFFLLEYGNPLTLAGESLGVKLNQSFFQSVIARTAGFNNVPISGLRDTTSFLLIMLMFVGGSPGSTAGGLKTTTFGVLLFTTFSTLKGEKEPLIYHKHIPTRTIRKALALVVISMLLIITVSFVLTITEQASFLDLIFETVSAYGTVGLSKGITGNLSQSGKLIITLTMYAGRVGPLSLGFAINNRIRPTNLRYPEANIAIG